MEATSERQSGDPRPLKTAQQITEAITEIEKVIAAVDEVRQLYVRYVYTNLPMGLAITNESVTEDMQHINLMYFRQRYIRSSLIVTLYELEKQAAQPENRAGEGGDGR